MPAKQRRIKLDYVPTAALIPNEKNARLHPEAQMETIVNSIKRYDFIVPILRDGDLNIVAGHARVEAALRAGKVEIPTINVDHLTQEELDEFLHVENRIGDMSNFDRERLFKEVGLLVKDDEDRERLLGLGFSKYELDGTIDPIGEKPPDEFPEYGLDIETKHECPKCGFSW